MLGTQGEPDKDHVLEKLPVSRNGQSHIPDSFCVPVSLVSSGHLHLALILHAAPYP